MVFSSNIFLFLFFPVVFIGYFILPRVLKNVFLLLASLFFYAWGEPRFVFVMMASILLNFAFALLINRARGGAAKVFLALAAGVNLGLLAVFKYLDFIIANLGRLLGLALPAAGIALPIGISFFTFQAMSYVIDVYRGTVKASRRPQDVGLYISFFPQLIAGPIVRYRDIEKEIARRSVSADDIGEGMRRFVLGLAKKVILANNLAKVADAAFGAGQGLSAGLAWLGVLAYAFQIYYDFSGYSDMAIGLGRMFGFHFLENFNYPYISKSITEFWRRWHISLGQWFRDYLYFPLGGSRVGSKLRLVANLFVVWLLTGLWHGASWNFVLWGLLFFVFISLEKLTGFPQRRGAALPALLYRLLCLFVILTGWVFFRAQGIAAALAYLGQMFGAGGAALWDNQAAFHLREYAAFFFAAFVFSAPVVPALRGWAAKKSRLLYRAGQVLAPAAYFGIFLLAVSYLVMGAHNPFIYFNF